MRKKISEILVKWNMPTRQVAINEILSLFKETIKEAKPKTNNLSQKPILDEFEANLLAKIEK